MAVPKKKTSKSKRNMRRSHDSLGISTTSTCSSCNEPVLPHHVCLKCGHYRGKKILDAKET